MNFDIQKQDIINGRNLFVKYKNNEELTNDELKLIIEHLLREINTISQLF